MLECDIQNESTRVPELSIVIPVYRSEITLASLTEQILDSLENIGVEYEIIFVEDDSSDSSWAVLCELQMNHPDRITTVRLMRNFGQHNALMCGFRRVRGRYVLTMDDDLQHPPEEIPKLLEAIKATDHDLVYGVPEKRTHRRWKNLGSLIASTFYRAVFKSDIQPTSFRIARRELVEAILSYSLNYTYIDGLFAWNTQRISEVAVQHRLRTFGRSGYSFTRLAALSLNLFTNFSLLPLQAVSALGVISALGGILTGLFFLVQYLMSNIAIPGYASIIVAIMVLGGIQLLSLGIIGEYLGRVHLNINRKPQYTVREVRETVNTTDPAETDTDSVGEGML